MASYNSSTTVLVRSTRATGEVTVALREAIRSVEPRPPLVYDGSALDVIALFFLPARGASVVLGAFGVLAIAIALVGIYGLASNAVSTRTREIGIRMVIARRHQVLRTLPGRAGVVLSAGAAAGLAASLALAPLLSAVVYTASTTDPAVLVGTARNHGARRTPRLLSASPAGVGPEPVGDPQGRLSLLAARLPDQLSSRDGWR